MASAQRNLQAAKLFARSRPVACTKNFARPTRFKRVPNALQIASASHGVRFPFRSPYTRSTPDPESLFAPVFSRAPRASTSRPHGHSPRTGWLTPPVSAIGRACRLAGSSIRGGRPSNSSNSSHSSNSSGRSGRSHQREPPQADSNSRQPVHGARRRPRRASHNPECQRRSPARRRPLAACRSQSSRSLRTPSPARPHHAPQKGRSPGPIRG